MSFAYVISGSKKQRDKKEELDRAVASTKAKSSGDQPAEAASFYLHLVCGMDIYALG